MAFHRLGEVCSHVGAVLFKLEACVRLGLNKVACTSKPCSWNQQFSKKVDPVCLVDIDFTQPKRSRAGKIKASHMHDENMATPKRKPKVPQPLSVEEKKENFLHNLHLHGCKSVILTTHDLLHTSYVPKPIINDMVNAVIPRPLTERFREQGVNLTIDEIVRKCEDIVSFSVTKNQVDYVELVTQNQADSMIWFEQRLGRITASKAYDVLRTNQDSPAKSLLQKICTLKYTKNNGKSSVVSLDWDKQ